MKQIKLTAAALFAASMLFVSCGGGEEKKDKTGADFAKDLCKAKKELEGAKDAAAAQKAVDDATKAYTEALDKLKDKPEDSKKFADDYAKEMENCK